MESKLQQQLGRHVTVNATLVQENEPLKAFEIQISVREASFLGVHGTLYPDLISFCHYSVTVSLKGSKIAKILSSRA